MKNTSKLLDTRRTQKHIFSNLSNQLSLLTKVSSQGDKIDSNSQYPRFLINNFKWFEFDKNFSPWFNCWKQITIKSNWIRMLKWLKSNFSKSGSIKRIIREHSGAEWRKMTHKSRYLDRLSYNFDCRKLSL